MKYSVLLLCLVLMGCTSFDNRREVWLQQVLDDTRKATMDMYSCAAETWTIKNGPECKKACSEYAELRQRELHPPDYVGALSYAEIMDDVSHASICKDIDQPSRNRVY